jgi:hypothetical protein
MRSRAGRADSGASSITLSNEGIDSVSGRSSGRIGSSTPQGARSLPGADVAVGFASAADWPDPEEPLPGGVSDGSSSGVGVGSNSAAESGECDETDAGGLAPVGGVTSESLQPETSNAIRANGRKILKRANDDE